MLVFVNATIPVSGKTGKAVANVATNPAETAAGVGKGVGRLLKGAGKSAKKAGETVAEVTDEGGAGDGGAADTTAKAAKSVTGASKAASPGGAR
jgi:hypothetical protein